MSCRPESNQGRSCQLGGRRSRPDWPSYLEVTISASDSRNVRDPSAPRAIRNQQQASPTQSALSRPLKNCSKKPDSALLRNLMDEFDVASTQSPSSDEGVEVPANPPPPQTSSAFQAASSAGGKPAIAEPQDALKTLGEGANDAARNHANSATQTRADADPPERHRPVKVLFRLSFWAGIIVCPSTCMVRVACKAQNGGQRQSLFATPCSLLHHARSYIHQACLWALHHMHVAGSLLQPCISLPYGSTPCSTACLSAFFRHIDRSASDRAKLSMAVLAGGISPSYDSRPTLR